MIEGKEDKGEEKKMDKRECIEIDRLENSLKIKNKTKLKSSKKNKVIFLIFRTIFQEVGRKKRDGTRKFQK